MARMKADGKEGGPRPSKTGTIRARIDPGLKAEAEAILAQLGLNSSDAIRLFYKQVTLAGGLPFPVAIPNAATRQALRDADEGEGLNRHGGVEEMFKKLGV